MPVTLSIEPFLQLRGTAPLLDVRSPGEFAKGHIPGARNLPLFDDEQRAEIGRLYRRTGREAALLKGLEIAGGRMRDLAAAALKNAKDHHSRSDAVLVHCWRGGMRSRSVAWLLEQVDLRVTMLDGGYRAWRRAGQSWFARPWKLVVLGGLTGSGKTRQLARLAEHGEQVVDLEGLANHRGSAFGGVGRGAQPSVEQFENSLHQRLRELDRTRRLWIEAESQSIGSVFVPGPFFHQALAAPLVELQVPGARRLELLADEYSQFPAEDLIACVRRIRKRLGDQRASQAVEAIERGEFMRCAEICLAWYDKSYGGPKSRQHRPTIARLEVSDPDNDSTTRLLIDAADELEPALAHGQVSQY